MADKKKFSAWEKLSMQRRYPTAQEFYENQVRWNPYAEKPETYVAPQPDMTLTGDMVTGSPKQNAAQAQFDANMRAVSPPVEPETPMELEDRLEREAYLQQLRLKNQNRVGG